MIMTEYDAQQTMNGKDIDECFWADPNGVILIADNTKLSDNHIPLQSGNKFNLHLSCTCRMNENIVI